MAHETRDLAEGRRYCGRRRAEKTREEAKEKQRECVHSSAAREKGPKIHRRLKLQMRRCFPRSLFLSRQRLRFPLPAKLIAVTESSLEICLPQRSSVWRHASRGRGSRSRSAAGGAENICAASQRHFLPAQPTAASGLISGTHMAWLALDSSLSLSLSVAAATCPAATICAPCAAIN